ncbi:MAG TPA: cysteine hydrolase family protein [Candidatus Nanopelagicaceae bacterium]|nr:cysteine hydrolase family protein [Candidatus Nanopelagicaceae bacterium]
MSQALLIIDIQNDYFPGGAMELVGSLEAAARAKDVLAHFRGRGLPVVHIQHVAEDADATFFLPNSGGVQINESVMPDEGEMLITKHHPNAFQETPLLGHLRLHQITQLLIVGMMTHMCIDSTTRAASDHGFEVTLVHDACATRDLSFGNASVTAEQVQTSFLAAIDGTFAEVRSTAEILRTS